MSLKRPCPTRWNSLFDCLEQIVEIMDVLDGMFDLLGFEKLNSVDRIYINH
jgi:hypothetical protein